MKPMQSPRAFRLQTLFVLSFAAIVLIFAGGIGLLLVGSRGQFLDQYATDNLTRALNVLEIETAAHLAPGRQTLHLCRDWAMDRVLSGADPSNVARLAPLVRASRGIQALYLSFPDGGGIALNAGPDESLRVRLRSRAGSAVHEAQWTAAGLSNLNPADADTELALDTQPWYAGATQLLQGRSDQNRGPDPETYFGLDDPGHLTAAMAVGSDTAAPFVAAVTFTADALAARLAQYDRPGDEEAVVLAESGDVIASSLAAASAGQRAIVAAAQRWQADPELADRDFSVPGGMWRVRYGALPLSPDFALHLGVALPAAAIATPLYPLRDGLVVMTLVTLTLGVLVALMLGWWLGRPMRAFVQQALRLDPFRVGQGHWPTTRVRELRELTDAFDCLAREARDLQHAARHSTSPRAAQAAPDETAPADDAVAPVSEEAPNETPETPPVPRPERAEPAPAPSPSPMFLQALQSARKGLRNAQQENEALLRELDAAAEAHAQREDRIAALAEALAALPEDARECLVDAAAALDGAHLAYWRFDADGQAMHRQAVSAASPAPPTCTHQDAPLFFSALQSESMLVAVDVAEDPRVAGIATPEDRSLLAIRVGASSGGGVLVATHRDAPHRWQPEEILFCHALAEMLRPAQAASAEVSTPSAPHYEEFEQPYFDEQSTPFPDADGERYRRLIESAAMVFFAADRKGRVTYANPNAELALDGVAEHWLGGPLKECLPGDAEAIDHALHDAMRGAAPRTVEGGKGTGGRWRFALAPLYDEDGEVNGVTVCGVLVPPPETVAAAQPHAPSEAERIAALPGAVLWSVDTIGCLTYIAPAAESLYGYTPRELKGRPLTALSGEEQGQRDLDQLSRLMDGIPCRGYRTLHRCKDGALIDVLVYAALLHDAEGQVHGAAGVVVPAPEDESDE